MGSAQQNLSGCISGSQTHVGGVRMNILLLGSSGYIGQAFKEELEARSIPYTTLGHTDPDLYIKIAKIMPSLIINCAAYIPKPSVSLCDDNKEETIKGNLMLPWDLKNICRAGDIPLAHISTGCLWSDGLEHGEDDTPQRAFMG